MTSPPCVLLGTNDHPAPQNVAILGSTGSIGTQTLRVIEHLSQQFVIQTLTAFSNTDLLTQQIHAHQPTHAWIGELGYTTLSTTKPTSTTLHTGTTALCNLASHPEVDIVVVGIVGMAGLAPTLAALKAGKKVLTANKETFVAGGHLVAPYMNQIIPVDSEHSAIFQCLDGHNPNEIQRLILTSSGGPFRNQPLENMKNITRADALTHPNWVMGQKITIDSATMMNKGLEVIEAHWLFQQPYDRIDILVHPQSIVHSGIEWIDGAITTQWGTPDMCLPIQYALTYPHRQPCAQPNTQRLDLKTLTQLNFEPVDPERFPSIAVAYHAGKAGNAACCVLNAANEVAVNRFLRDELHFMDIIPCVETTLNHLDKDSISASPDLETLTQLDHQAREWAKLYKPLAVHPQ